MHLDEQIKNQFLRATVEQSDATLRLLKTAPGKAAQDVVADAQTRMQRGMDDSPKKLQRDCCQGCFFCCYIPVTVSPPEAISIAERLREQRTPEELKALETELEEAASRIALLTEEEHMVAKIPCVFLDDGGRCSIYDFRPLPCRGMTSTDVARCRATYEGTADSWPNDEFADSWQKGIVMGLLAGLKRFGRVDFDSYELHSAVKSALRCDDASSRWARGERIFDSSICRSAGITGEYLEETVRRARRMLEASTTRIRLAHEAEIERPGVLGAEPRSSSRVGRNEACPCGSGKKFKNCCLRKSHDSI